MCVEGVEREQGGVRSDFDAAVACCEKDSCRRGSRRRVRKQSLIRLKGLRRS